VAGRTPPPVSRSPADNSDGDGLVEEVLRKAFPGFALLQLTAAEQRRRDVVEGGGLVQPHERVRPEPVSADTVATVDQGHAYVGVVDQGDREGHPHGTGPTTR
jgi:hypothetical protein